MEGFSISDATTNEVWYMEFIGKGSFGKVFLVRHKQHHTLHALKVLKKDFIIRKNQVEHTKTERSVLGYARHPYIVGLTMAFQTRDKLFFVLDYCAGGELFCHLQRLGKFAEPRARSRAPARELRPRRAGARSPARPPASPPSS